MHILPKCCVTELYVCVCVCVFVRARTSVCVCARTMYNVTLRHSLSDGQRKTANANDNYNQHLKAKALRDTYNANIEKAEKVEGRRTATGSSLVPRPTMT